MNTYNCTFIGRKNNAIGVSYRITDTVEASNPEEARLRLYDKYEHITVLRIEAVPHTTDTAALAPQ